MTVWTIANYVVANEETHWKTKISEEALESILDIIREAMRKAAELLPFPQNEGLVGRLNRVLIDINDRYSPRNNEQSM